MTQLENLALAAMEKYSHRELALLACKNGLFVEKLIAESAGAVHNTAANGADAYFSDGTELEIKTQIDQGNQLVTNYGLKGRAKYSSPTWEIYNKKLAANEKTIVVGSCSKTGTVYYMFSFDFAAIAPWFKRHLTEKLDRQGRTAISNIDAYYYDYNQHSSFQVLYTADPDTLLENRSAFETTKFFNYLMKLSVTAAVKQRI